MSRLLWPPWSYSGNWDPGLGMQGGNGAAGELGAATGPGSQDSQLHPPGAPAVPTAPPASGLEALAYLAGLFPRTPRLDLGSPLAGSPGSVHVATATNLTRNPERFIFNLGSDSACLRGIAIYMFKGLPGPSAVKCSLGPYFKRSPRGRKGPSQSHAVVLFFFLALFLSPAPISLCFLTLILLPLIS